jgi:hypothetical protein
MHLDAPGLISLSEQIGQPLRWATRKENAYASEMRGRSDLDVFRGKRLASASDVGGLGSGIVARVLYDFMRPKSAIGMAHYPATTDDEDGPDSGEG